MIGLTSISILSSLYLKMACKLFLTSETNSNTSTYSPLDSIASTVLFQDLIFFTTSDISFIVFSQNPVYCSNFNALFNAFTELSKFLTSFISIKTPNASRDSSHVIISYVDLTVSRILFHSTVLAFVSLSLVAISLNTSSSCFEVICSIGIFNNSGFFFKRSVVTFSGFNKVLPCLDSILSTFFPVIGS